MGVLYLHAAVPHKHHKIDLTLLDHHAHYGRIHPPSTFQDELIHSDSEVKIPSFDLDRRLKTKRIEKAPAFSFISSNAFLHRTVKNTNIHLPYLKGKYLVSPKPKPLLKKATMKERSRTTKSIIYKFF